MIQAVILTDMSAYSYELIPFCKTMALDSICYY